MNESWVACSLDLNNLASATDLVLEEWPILSCIQCLATASLLDWVFLVLFAGTSGCTFYGLQSLAVLDVIKDLTAGSGPCRIRNKFVGKKLMKTKV